MRPPRSLHPPIRVFHRARIESTSAEETDAAALALERSGAARASEPGWVCLRGAKDDAVWVAVQDPVAADDRPASRSVALVQAIDGLADRIQAIGETERLAPRASRTSPLAAFVAGALALTGGAAYGLFRRQL